MNMFICSNINNIVIGVFISSECSMTDRKQETRASRDHKRYQETLTEEFEQLQRDKELQFATSEKRMGRPPVQLAVLQRRALNKYITSLDACREIEAKEGVEPWSECDVISYKLTDTGSGNSATRESISNKIPSTDAPALAERKH